MVRVMDRVALAKVTMATAASLLAAAAIRAGWQHRERRKWQECVWTIAREK